MYDSFKVCTYGMTGDHFNSEEKSVFVNMIFDTYYLQRYIMRIKSVCKQKYSNKFVYYGTFANHLQRAIYIKHNQNGENGAIYIKHSQNGENGDEKIL